MENLLIHIQRLERHYKSSLSVYDPISLLDLSHSLRMICELKEDLNQKYEQLSSTKAFKNGAPIKSVSRALSNVNHIISYMPTMTKVYLKSGEIMSYYNSLQRTDVSVRFTFRSLAKGTWQEGIGIKDFAYIENMPDEKLNKALKKK